MTTDQTPRSSWLHERLVDPILGAIGRTAVRFGRLSRIANIRILVCVEEPRPYLEKLESALNILKSTDPDSLERGRRCWFAISIRELPEGQPVRWSRHLRILEFSAAALGTWNDLMVAGSMAKYSIMNHLRLAAAKDASLDFADIDRQGERHAQWFFSQFSDGMVHDAQASLDTYRALTKR
jgi:hypothetical protein